VSPVRNQSAHRLQVARHAHGDPASARSVAAARGGRGYIDSVTGVVT